MLESIVLICPCSAMLILLHPGVASITCVLLPCSYGFHLLLVSYSWAFLSSQPGTWNILLNIKWLSSRKLGIITFYACITVYLKLTSMLLPCSYDCIYICVLLLPCSYGCIYYLCPPYVMLMWLHLLVVSYFSHVRMVCIYWFNLPTLIWYVHRVVSII